jgi:hypothetical protein
MLFELLYKIGERALNPLPPKRAGTATPVVRPRQVTPPAPKPAKPLTHAVGVVQAARAMLARFPELAGGEAVMAGAMAMIESGGNTFNLNPRATRFEPGFMRRYIVGKAAEAYGRTVGYTARELSTSYGIGQVMLQSAIELYRRGYRSYGYPSPNNLKNPETGLYFMLAAQADIVKRSGNRSEAFVVQSYNGGIGASNAQTQNHLAKYNVSKARLTSELA